MNKMKNPCNKQWEWIASTQYYRETPRKPCVQWKKSDTKDHMRQVFNDTAKTTSHREVPALFPISAFYKSGHWNAAVIAQATDSFTYVSDADWVNFQLTTSAWPKANCDRQLQNKPPNGNSIKQTNKKKAHTGKSTEMESRHCDAKRRGLQQEGRYWLP